MGGRAFTWRYSSPGALAPREHGPGGLRALHALLPVEDVVERAHGRGLVHHDPVVELQAVAKQLREVLALEARRHGQLLAELRPRLSRRAAVVEPLHRHGLPRAQRRAVHAAVRALPDQRALAEVEGQADQVRQGDGRDVDREHLRRGRRTGAGSRRVRASRWLGCTSRKEKTEQ
jgi:hypothetical protein